MLGIYHREGILDLCYSLDDRGLVSKECFKKELFKVALMFHPFLPDYCQGIVVHNDDDVWLYLLFDVHELCRIVYLLGQL